MKVNYWKVIEVLGIALVITSGVIAIQIYYNQISNKCISDPLVYAAQTYEEKTGYEFVGSGNFIGNLNPSQSTIYFNSERSSLLPIYSNEDYIIINSSLFD